AYIVYMGDKPKGDIDLPSIHLSMLEGVMGSNASRHPLYSYKRSFNGFAVKLTEKEAQTLSDM
ncbi:Peptidase S8 propeptide/proteinase inhibitor I9, partial [Dillenia turbinata]